MGQETTQILQRIRLSGQTANNSFNLPANAVLHDILIQETAGNAITGGLSFGTTNAGTDIVVAQAVGASSLGFVTGATLLKRWFSTSAAQTIYFNAVSAFNSANVTITLYYYQQ